MITNSPFLSYCEYSTVYLACPYSRITKSNSTSLYCWAGLGNIMGYHWPTTQKKNIACLALLIWHCWFDSLCNLGVSLSPLKGNSTWTPYVYMGELHAHIFLGSFSSSWFPWLFQMSSLLVILPHTVVSTFKPFCFTISLSYFTSPAFYSQSHLAPNHCHMASYQLHDFYACPSLNTHIQRLKTGINIWQRTYNICLCGSGLSYSERLFQFHPFPCGFQFFIFL